jgi:hypothetical protein
VDDDSSDEKNAAQSFVTKENGPDDKTIFHHHPNIYNESLVNSSNRHCCCEQQQTMTTIYFTKSTDADEFNDFMSYLSGAPLPPPRKEAAPAQAANCHFAPSQDSGSGLLEPLLNVQMSDVFDPSVSSSGLCSDDTLHLRSNIVDDDVQSFVTKENGPDDKTIFSDKEPFEEQFKDILTEGQYYLGISMLVYMYSHLRETCRMGHTDVKMKDIDVNSHQSQYYNGTNNKYLSCTKTADSIVQLVVSELGTHDNKEVNDLIGKENKEYEKR